MKRVLIANRGEIAVRIIRACHEDGIEAVAVYSEPDELSLHVQAADAAVEIGPARSSESYLSIPKILEAAKRTGADAIHPGYGFLAERADFAEAVIAAGLIFIGPPASAIAAMGGKTEARRRMAEAGVPIVPGTTEPLADVAEALARAEDLGFPVLLKAVAGGGGRGMRVATSPDEVESGFSQASSEARSAFGDAAVYIERFMERPHHIEVQVLADDHGNTIHLGERECSVQRRHQKLIEESPAPNVDMAMRSEMGAAAVKAAVSVGYRGVGTVEFLVDASGAFYFLEMNTRLQVEHPVTELVYGVDLVREQLRIARGEPMGCPTGPLQPRGHAIECRITAEDPFAGFVPSAGRIEYLQVPTGPGVRWDGGIQSGTEISLYYDSLLGKVIVWGDTREHAIHRMRRALEELAIVGVATSQPFHRRVMEEPEFVAGKYDIGYVDSRGNALMKETGSEEMLRAIAIAAALAEDERRGARVPTRERPSRYGQDSAWVRAARVEGLRR